VIFSFDFDLPPQLCPSNNHLFPTTPDGILQAISISCQLLPQSLVEISSWPVVGRYSGAAASHSLRLSKPKRTPSWSYLICSHCWHSPHWWPGSGRPSGWPAPRFVEPNGIYWGDYITNIYNIQKKKPCAFHLLDLASQQGIDGIQPVVHFLVAKGLQQIATMFGYHTVNKCNLYLVWIQKYSGVLKLLVNVLFRCRKVCNMNMNSLGKTIIHCILLDT